uniref:Eukaryotic translation initiation factor 3 subunit K n=1 Tax=Oryctolagus cuniculus TaxID=9986 RepID=A0A5F9C0Q3_RABIT
MAMFEQMRANVGKLLKGIDRYNPENLATLERYVETQAKENAYDLEANLAVLKLYQFNPAFFQTTVTAQILLKALTNLPHTDFTLCKCMIDQAHQEERPIRQILYLGDLLETCHFQAFWQALDENMDLLEGITGFEDSVRKFICHVVGITYQHIDRWLLAEMLGDLTDSQLKMWMSKYGWSADESGQIFICSQEESIKPKNIVEKIDFDNLHSLVQLPPAQGRHADREHRRGLPRRAQAHAPARGHFGDRGRQCEDDPGHDLDHHPEVRHPGYLCGRDLCQGGAPSVVPEKDGAVQERQRAELPHQLEGWSRLQCPDPPAQARADRV